MLTRPNCAFFKPANDAGFLVYEVQNHPFHAGSNAHHQLRFMPGGEEACGAAEGCCQGNLLVVQKFMLLARIQRAAKLGDQNAQRYVSLCELNIAEVPMN